MGVLGQSVASRVAWSSAATRPGRARRQSSPGPHGNRGHVRVSRPPRPVGSRRRDRRGRAVVPPTARRPGARGATRGDLGGVAASSSSVLATAVTRSVSAPRIRPRAPAPIVALRPRAPVPVAAPWCPARGPRPDERNPPVGPGRGPVDKHEVGWPLGQPQHHLGTAVSGSGPTRTTPVGRQQTSTARAATGVRTHTRTVRTRSPFSAS